MGKREPVEPMECPECLGSGYVQCPACDGEGYVETKGEGDDDE